MLLILKDKDESKAWETLGGMPGDQNDYFSFRLMDFNLIQCRGAFIWKEEGR